MKESFWYQGFLHSTIASKFHESKHLGLSSPKGQLVTSDCDSVGRSLLIEDD